MTKEEKYELALRTIYNTLKEREFTFTLQDKTIIKTILKYIETVEKFIEDQEGNMKTKRIKLNIIYIAFHNIILVL